ncbi:T9SS type A sorting domain-containing protein [Rufibacter sp. LB8]|uniref:T9SS type A sorting domain-containing protein n=1 Tax=Rufibacter sp. LB8 TaxID=2777781 RepID=UPI00178C5083|nr:T9SS type A sorting domain-containing protein [Rufibacter sp. LB8]
MKKKLPFLLCLGLLGYTSASAQSFTLRNLNSGGVQHADISVVDVDSDGDLDIFLSGDGPQVDGVWTRIKQLYLNNGSGVFTAVESPFMGGGMATIDWGDINGDGKLDMVQAGFAANGYSALYTSNGTGTFTPMTVDPDFAASAPNVGFADLNNDGYQDIYSFSNANIGRSVLYMNDKQGGFTVSEQFDNFAFIDPQVSVVDFDNDGDLDLFVNAYDENNRTRFSKMFVNTNGTFAVRDLGLKQKGFGSATWGDYDGDGDLDMLLNGDGYQGTGEDSDDVYRLYKNTNGVFAEATTFTRFRQISVGDGGKFADWDNDGDLDIIVTGWAGDLNRQATAIFLNTNGTFAPMTNNDKLPGVSESSIEVADIDGDSDLDLLLTGFSGNNFEGAGTAFNSQISMIVVNPATTVNAAPAAPANLRVTAGTGGAMTFSWDAAVDATTPQAGLTYNLFLMNLTTGRTFSYAMADTTSGKLMLQRMGNVQMNKSWTINGLPNGRYRVGVQAVDNSFAGSPFMMKSLTITNGVITSVRDERAPKQMAVYPNPSTGRVAIKFTNGKKYQVNVSALDGRLLKTVAVDGEANLNLTPGMYMLQIRDTNGAVETQRLIVQ